MATFPTIYVHGTLAHQPKEYAYSDTIAIDPTIRSPKDAGYVKTRARFTRIVRQYTVRFEGVSTTNKDTIITFEEARYIGAESFTWVDPAGTSHTVRFVGPVMYDPWPNTNFSRWNIEFTLEEV